MRSWISRVMWLSLWAVVLVGMTATVPRAAAGEEQDAPDDEALVGRQEEELRKDAERRPRPGGRKPLRDLPRRPLKTDQGADREEERGTGAEED